MKSINNVSVENMENGRGNKVANQFVIWTDNGRYFQSYRSVIAFKSNEGKIALDPKYWDYSATTLKYLKLFLHTTDSKKEIEKKIHDGIYELADLNK
jgi:hypothetical protein